MNILLVILSIVVIILIGAIIILYRQSREELKRADERAQQSVEDKGRVESLLESKELEIRGMIAECATYKSRLEKSDELLAEQAEAHRKSQIEWREGEERMREQFKVLANDILSEQSRQFKSSSRESMDLLLKPFKDNISDFKERVERIYSFENEQRGALQNELRNLMELNRKITTETTNLTNALKGNSKVQGDWGEMILETILDSSSLEKGVHYSTQSNFKDDEGNNLRPDVVLNLPDSKQIVIDSKTSLTSFVAYMASDSEAERAVLMESHLKSIRQHINELGRKEYQKLVNSPDFVIMFIPNEPAFLSALQADATLWSDAYNKKVIISSPTNLFALLKLVDDLWKRNAQSKNNEAIVKNATKLYEQLINFSSSLEDVGKALDGAQLKYADAYKRLHTGNDNIARLGDKLLKLGLPTKKRLSERMLEGNEDVESDID